MNRLLFCVVLLLSTSANGQSVKPLEQLQHEEKLKSAIATLNEFDAMFNRMTVKRKAECAMAFGHESFCTCLMTELPIAWTFIDYVAITTKTKEENGYSTMDGEMRAAYEKVAPIRNKCVAKINTKP
jgi:hypothetical protein